ncbi:uncharacterized protein [Coffea arabica]|uniref:CCHC-type domain-containing protein n=1 Tax=Coffea arabica TaxID=13443 RepID=A0ABM4V3D0_COFAR
MEQQHPTADYTLIFTVMKNKLRRISEQQIEELHSLFDELSKSLTRDSRSRSTSKALLETPKTRSRDIKCFKCQGFGHIQSQCPNQRVILITHNDEIVFDDDDCEEMPGLIKGDCLEEDSVEKDCSPTQGEVRCLVTRRVLTARVKEDEQLQRENLFYTRCKVGDKVCSLIIDSGSCTNVVSLLMVESLALPTTRYPHPYCLQWLSEDGEDCQRRKQKAVDPGKSSISTNVVELDKALLASIVALLQEFKNVFPDEIPDGLPPIRGIEHQIDLILGAPLPNKPAYRMGPEETKEAVNVITVKYRHLIPKLDDMLDELDGAGINVDESMIEAIKQWPTPTSVHEVRSFHGLAGFYQRFVKDFSTIATPLTAVTKKNDKFHWGEAQGQTFLTLKDKLTHAPILALPNFNKTFEIESDDFGVVADALSRRHSLLVVLDAKLLGFEMLKEIYAHDHNFGEVYASCINNPHGKYFLHNGFLFYVDKLCVPNSSIHDLLIQEAHSGGLMGYFGIVKTLAMLQEHFTGLRCVEMLNACVTFNVVDLSPLLDEEDSDLKANPSQEEGADVCTD